MSAGDGKSSRFDGRKEVEHVLQGDVGSGEPEVVEDLQDVSPGPVAVVIKLLLPLGRRQLQKLVVFQDSALGIPWGKVRHQLEEISA